MHSIIERVKQFGVLGKTLLPFLKNNDLYLISRPPSLQWLHLDRLVTNNEYVKAIAFSLLICKYPMQIQLPESVVVALCWACFSGEFYVYDINEKMYDYDRNVVVNVDGELYGQHVYKFKTVAGAQSKLNMYFSEVWTEICNNYSVCADSFRTSAYLTDGFYNDQASAAALYSVVLSGKFINSATFACALVRWPDVAKVVNVAIKSLGINGTQLGAMLCEANTLTGRGVGEIDLRDEGLYRCVESRVSMKVVNVDSSALRAAVRRVIMSELAEMPEFDDVETFWDRRWVWCVNGSHSKSLLKVHPEAVIPDLGVSEVHRRVFAENIASEPISSWDGVGAYGASLKLEHGKLRALFAGDSLTYFAFEHLLRPVEKVWTGHRVVLDPGRGGLVGMVERIRKLRERAAVNVMVDYDDFNSQHSIESMKIVFTELCDIVGYSKDLTDNIVSSFDKQNIFVGGEWLGVLKGTLCSGHRATTFINSVLNAAYMAVSYESFWSLKSVHVGDDVYVGCSDFDQAVSILDSMAKDGFRINPVKQSVGVHTAEFLRTAITSKGAWGYVCRSIASCVSGNWLVKFRQSPDEALRTMVQHSWTLMNRSNDSKVWRLLCRSVCRLTRIKGERVRLLLSGSVALGDGPVRSRTTFYRYMSPVISARFRDDVEYNNKLRNVISYATDSYLSKCLDPVEAYALHAAQKSVKLAMLDSSYSKTLAKDVNFDDGNEECKFVTGVKALSGAITVERAIHHRAVDGVLSRYPVLHLLKKAMTLRIVKLCLKMLGVAAGVDPMLTAWGSESHGVVVDGVIPYSDACHLGNCVLESILVVTFPVHS